MSTRSRHSPTSSLSCEQSTFISVDSADNHTRPVIFELRDLNDNLELQKAAGRLLATLTSITPSLDLIDPLMDKLISILKDSAVSVDQFFRRTLADIDRSVLANQDALHAGTEFAILPKPGLAVRDMQGKVPRCECLLGYSDLG